MGCMQIQPCLLMKGSAGPHTKTNRKCCRLKHLVTLTTNSLICGDSYHLKSSPVLEMGCTATAQSPEFIRHPSLPLIMQCIVSKMQKLLQKLDFQVLPYTNYCGVTPCHYLHLYMLQCSKYPHLQKSRDFILKTLGENRQMLLAWGAKFCLQTVS